MLNLEWSIVGNGLSVYEASFCARPGRSCVYLKRRPVCSVFGTPPQMLLMEIRDFLMKFCLVKIALVLAQLDLTALVENLDFTEAVLFFFF